MRTFQNTESNNNPLVLPHHVPFRFVGSCAPKNLPINDVILGELLRHIVLHEPMPQSGQHIGHAIVLLDQLVLAIRNDLRLLANHAPLVRHNIAAPMHHLHNATTGRSDFVRLLLVLLLVVVVVVDRLIGARRFRRERTAIRARSTAELFVRQRDRLAGARGIANN